MSTFLEKLLVIAALVAVSACKKDAGSQAVDDAAPPSRDDAAIIDAAAIDAAAIDAARGSPLAKLRPGMKGGVDAIAAVLPGYEVIARENAIEEGMRPIVEAVASVDGRDAAMMRVEQGSVFEVRIYDPSFVPDNVPAAVGAVLETTDRIDGCGCQGEDGTDGFLCSVLGTDYELVFETAEGDCGIFDIEDVKKAVQGREVQALRLSSGE